MTATGLRRFAVPGGAPGRASGWESGPGPAAGSPRPAPAIETCEMCAAPLDERHGHVVDLDERSLMCTCRACYLLFTASGAGRGRHRAIPEDVWVAPEPLTAAEWDSLQVPVGTAFFFVNSDLGRVVGCYPSPGGATECELDLAGWERLVAEHPMLAAIEPDVQAVFASRTGSTVAVYLAPIDACYGFVGGVRRAWRGLDGGDEVRDELDRFLGELKARASVWGQGAPARPGEA